MFEGDFWMWKDSVDPDMYHIGVKFTGSNRFCMWASMHCDAVSDMFGRDFFHNVKESKSGVPFHVSIKLELD